MLFILTTDGHRDGDRRVIVQENGIQAVRVYTNRPVGDPQIYDSNSNFFPSQDETTQNDPRRLPQGGKKLKTRRIKSLKKNS